MKIMNIMVLGAMLWTAPLYMNCQSEQQTSEVCYEPTITKQSLTWLQRVWQKIVCINLVMTGCSTYHGTVVLNDMCQNCYKCLEDPDTCEGL